MNPRRFLPHAILALLMLMVSLTLCAAQVGQIKGNIVDEKTGEPLYGVSVQIEGTVMVAKSDFDGDFQIISVPPGVYTVVFSVIGYENYKVTDVKVDPGWATEVNLQMKQSKSLTGDVTEVKGTKKGIDFKTTGTQSQKNLQEIQMVPVGTVDDLLRKETGTSADAEGELNVRGGRAGETTYLGNGIKFSDPLGGRSGARKNQSNIVGIPKPVAEWQDDRVTRYNISQSRIKRKPRVHQQPPYWCQPPHSDPYDAMYFQDYGTNPFIDTEEDHLSTFAIDVDDASYVLTRSYLERGDLPPEDAIRVEEFVNHFNYEYDSPRGKPFAVYFEGAPSRFGRNSHLLRIGIKGREIAQTQRKPANLVFVIDVSGSMNRENRLELVKRSLYFLVDELEKHDNIGIVAFNTQGRVVLPMTPVRNRSRIFEAIHRLAAGGSTNAGEGLRLGYNMARNFFDEERINRVIMCSDGVANTGTTNPDELLRRIKKSAKMGITLSTVGVGMGNYNDVLLEKLGDKGNGHYAYVDDLEEAKRVFVENLTGNLEVIARDVKIQVDFDPEIVRSYRLLGFENRDVADHKFRDDREDGGEIGAGHEVTALYEIKFENRRGHVPKRLGKVFIRFKDADGLEVSEVSGSITRRVFNQRFVDCTPQFKLAAAAAEFAEILKDTPWTRGSSLHAVYNLVRDINDEWDTDESKELMRLVRRADQLFDSHAER